MAWWPWLAILAAVALLGGFATGWPLLQHVAYSLAGLDGLGLALVVSARRGLVVHRKVDRDELFAGEIVTETRRFEKTSWWPALGVDALDQIPGDEGTRLILVGRKNLTRTRRYIMPRRGRYQLGSGSIKLRDPLGLFLVTLASAPGPEVTVYPRPIPVVDLVPSLQAAITPRHHWIAGADDLPGDLRPYRAGDPPSRIHWRSTARHGTMIVSDPEAPRRDVIWLLVDLAGSPEDIDTAAGIAAYLVEQICAAGRDIGAVLAGADVRVIAPRRGPDVRRPVHDGLATVAEASRSQCAQLVRVGSHCEHPAAFVLISSSEPPEDGLADLRKLCRSVTFVPARIPASMAGEMSPP